MRYGRTLVGYVELWIAVVLLAFACAYNTAKRPPFYRASVMGAARGTTRTGDVVFRVELVWEENGVTRSEAVVLDWQHYGRIRELSEVCLYPTVYGLDVRACPGP
jgi:hypothetical protein